MPEIRKSGAVTFFDEAVVLVALMKKVVVVSMIVVVVDSIVGCVSRCEEYIFVGCKGGKSVF